VEAQNVHATAIVLGTRGLMIVGPSGSGKTALALALVDAWNRRGQFGRLVADDQILLTCTHGRLVGSAPAAIAGLAEIAGLGPRPLSWQPRAVIDGFCRLVPAADVPRLQDDRIETFHGVGLRGLDVPARNITAALPALTVWIETL